MVAEARYGDAAATEATFDAAAHVVALDLRNQRLSPVSLDRAVPLAEHDTARRPHHVRTEQPDALRRDATAWRRRCSNVPAEKVRVLVGDVGGGFGMKTGLYPEDAVVAFAARQGGAVR